VIDKRKRCDKRKRKKVTKDVKKREVKNKNKIVCEIVFWL